MVASDMLRAYLICRPIAPEKRDALSRWNRSDQVSDLFNESGPCSAKNASMPSSQAQFGRSGSSAAAESCRKRWAVDYTTPSRIGLRAADEADRGKDWSVEICARIASRRDFGG